MASEPMQKFLIKPGCVALAATGLVYAMYPIGSIDVAGMDMPGALGIGVCAFAADIIAELVDEQLKNSDQARAMVDLESGLVRPAVTGLALLGASAVLIVPQADMSAMAQIFGIGALSQVTGGYVYDITNGLYTR
jgi:hypothetical protein